jgi:glucans biosynthesis protein C
MTRRHDLDALRVFAFGSLILYHGAMLYVADWDWHLKSSYLGEWLQWPMLAINRWRMALLFLISGLAIGLYQPARAAGGFAWNRTRRVLLPLLFGMVALVPVQAYCQAVANGAVEPGFGAFLWRYLQFRPWPAEAFDGAEYGVTWNHLWYLAYLWVYSLLLVALLPLLESAAGRRWQAAFAGLRGWRLLVLPALPLALYTNLLMPRFPVTHDLISDGFQHAQFFTVFLYGYALARARGFWDELVRQRRRLAAVALALAVVYVPWVLLAAAPMSEFELVVVRTLRAGYLWVALLAILGWSKHALDRPFRWLPYANEAVLPWYMLHQSLTVLLAWWLVPRELGPVLEPLLVIGGTLAGCLLLHELLIRRSRLLRPLFGLKPPRPVADAHPPRGQQPAAGALRR